MSSSSAPFVLGRKTTYKNRNRLQARAEKNFDLQQSLLAPDGLWGRPPQPGVYQKSTSLLKPKRPLLVFCVPRYAVRAPLEGPAETGAGGVRRLLVPNLLNGGFGYENLRLHSPVAVDDRLFPLLRSRRCSAACGQPGQLPPLPTAPDAPATPSQNPPPFT